VSAGPIILLPPLFLSPLEYHRKYIHSMVFEAELGRKSSECDNAYLSELDNSFVKMILYYDHRETYDGANASLFTSVEDFRHSNFSAAFRLISRGIRIFDNHPTSSLLPCMISFGIYLNLHSFP
jgi:hypothetical protein